MPSELVGKLRYFSDWLPEQEARELFETFLDTLPWKQRTIRMFGKEVLEPRLCCWVGDPGANYKYSGRTNTPMNWTKELSQLRHRLQEEFSIPVNSVLANLYRDGADSMGWHSDNEPELGVEATIFSVSLGGERRFWLKHKQYDTYRTSLEHGSLLVMSGDLQLQWKHSIPKETKTTNPRINLTFRNVLS